MKAWLFKISLDILGFKTYNTCQYAATNMYASMLLLLSQRAVAGRDPSRVNNFLLLRLNLCGIPHCKSDFYKKTEFSPFLLLDRLTHMVELISKVTGDAEAGRFGKYQIASLVVWVAHNGTIIQLK